MQKKGITVRHIQTQTLLNKDLVQILNHQTPLTFMGIIILLEMNLDMMGQKYIVLIIQAEIIWASANTTYTSIMVSDYYMTTQN